MSTKACRHLHPLLMMWLGICLTLTQWETCFFPPHCLWEHPKCFLEPSIQILIKNCAMLWRKSTRRKPKWLIGTHEKRLHEPALQSLNKRAGKKSKENLQQAATKMGEYSLFVVMVNWTKNSMHKLPEWKKWKVWRAKSWNIWQWPKTCQISIPENFCGDVKWHLRRRGKMI